MSPKARNERCPCHSGKKYKKCCAPFHDGQTPPTPEALMRSRYAAYALGLADYVIDTTAPGGPGVVGDRATWVAGIQDFGRSTSFVGLEILGSGAEGDHGWVRFKAILLAGAADASFEERSGFVRTGGRWLYASGARS